jgi:hypothetical protein
MTIMFSYVFCRADDEDIDFPDLAVTQTQQSHTINVSQTSIQRNDVYGSLDREASAGKRVSTHQLPEQNPIANPSRV